MTEQALHPVYSPAGHDPPAPIPILLVDDDPDCRLLLRDAILACRVPCIIHETANGAEALALVHRLHRSAPAQPPALIFMDVEMPVMDGLSALARLRTEPSTRHVPVVIVSGTADESCIARAAALGANSFVPKSIDAGRFLRALSLCARYWLTVHQLPAFPSNDTNSTPEVFSDLPHLANVL